ncbi:MAG: hypothetical protein AAF628_18205 [Planctomycetota bacterium]
MIRSRISSAKALFCVCLLGVSPVFAPAQDHVKAVSRFVGQASENLDDIISTSFRIRASIDVFGGDVTFASLLPPPYNTTIHLWLGSCFAGTCAVPRSPSYLIGATSPQSIVFNRPAMRFGAYFTNTSGRADATATFYDTTGALLESETVTIPWRDENWYWNGWESDTPLGRIEIHGNGSLQGFIWLDDLEVDYDVVARCATRNGTGVNPADFSCQSPPALGSDWVTTVDTTPTAGQSTLATAVLVGLGGPLSGTLVPFGELLVLTPSELDTRTGPAAGTHTIPVPLNPSLSGAPISTQGVRLEASPTGPNQIVLLNAIDLVIGV